MVLRDTYIEVNLDTIKYNMNAIQGLVGRDVAIIAVVKANAYGLGAIDVSRVLMEAGATYIAVATLTEAIEIKEVHPEYPVFILGYTPDILLPYIIKYNIIQTIFEAKQARILSELALQNQTVAKVHIKVDTGFHRLGTYDIDEIEKICSYRGVTTEGIFSHLALVNDEENKKQFDLFMSIIDKLEEKGIAFKYRHIADSISLVDFPEYRLNMVRPGALIYGLRGFHKGFLPVESCMSFKTAISQIHFIKKSEGVGYDYLWRAPKDTVIGTLPFGYADGYPRNMRDKGYVTIKRIKCPIIGVICMDQCMVDLTLVDDPKVGDICIIYGDGSNNTMSIQEASTLAVTNKNDIISRFTKRVPRIYIENVNK